MMNADRYSRHTMLPEIGEEGQRRLACSSALIVGLGGLGSPVAAYLTAAGVGRIGLCDPDTVSESNLQRQILYTEADLGLPKTECAARRLHAMSGHTRFDLLPEGLTAENAEGLIAPYDIVVDCCDNFATRYLIDDTCAALGKTWVHGAIGAFNGQIAVFNGHRRRRYTHLFPDSDTLRRQPAAAGGVLGAVPGVIGAMEACEALKILAGMEAANDGRLFTINLITFETNTIEI